MVVFNYMHKQIFAVTYIHLSSRIDEQAGKTDFRIAVCTCVAQILVIRVIMYLYS